MKKQRNKQTKKMKRKSLAYTRCLFVVRACVCVNDKFCKHFARTRHTTQMQKSNFSFVEKCASSTMPFYLFFVFVPNTVYIYLEIMAAYKIRWLPSHVLWHLTTLQSYYFASGRSNIHRHELFHIYSNRCRCRRRRCYIGLKERWQLCHYRLRHRHHRRGLFTSIRCWYTAAATGTWNSKQKAISTRHLLH